MVIAGALAAVAIDAAKRTARIYHFHPDLVEAPLEVTDESGELAPSLGILICRRTLCPRR